MSAKQRFGLVPTGRRKLITPLDRYVASEFSRIFLVTLAGFPVLVFVIDLVDNLRKYTERKLALKAVAMSYMYWIPDTLFMVLPAAVLFATVFSIGTFTRYSEISAAKASGISFYRFISPILLMSMVAMGIGLVFSELAPPANAKRLELLAGSAGFNQTTRYNFAFANKELSDTYGWDKAQVGSIITFSTLLYGLSAMFNGPIADKFGGRRAMLIGASGACVYQSVRYTARAPECDSP